MPSLSDQFQQYTRVEHPRRPVDLYETTIVRTPILAKPKKLLPFLELANPLPVRSERERERARARAIDARWPERERERETREREADREREERREKRKDAILFLSATWR